MLVITSRTGNLYNGDVIAHRAEVVLGRKSPEYLRIKDLIMEFTQSCDKQEVIAWMEHYMHQALAFETGKPIMDEIHKNLCLAGTVKEAAGMFLAAYDIYKEVA